MNEMTDIKINVTKIIKMYLVNIYQETHKSTSVYLPTIHDFPFESSIAKWLP